MSNLAEIRESSKGFQELSLENTLFNKGKIFVEEITAESALNFAKEFMHLAKTKELIDLYIYSNGGDVNAGLLIYDMLQSCPIPVNTYCIGHAYSMGAVLLAAGQKGRRFILPHSRVMIHEVLVPGGLGGSATSISRVSESIIETRDLLNGILAAHTGKSVEEIGRATSFDNFMNAQEAVEFGICDKIIETVF